MDVPGLPKPLACLLRGLLEENRLSSWTSDWNDGEVNVTIRFSPLAKKPSAASQQSTLVAAKRKNGDTTEQYSVSSDSDEDAPGGRGGKVSTSNCQEGTVGKPRRYHLIEVANSPPGFSSEVHSSFEVPRGVQCMTRGAVMHEDVEKQVRGMTSSASSSSEDVVLDVTNAHGQKVRSYREMNLREFGNRYCSTSAENSSPEGYDEVDNIPLKDKVYNQTNASNTADNFDATRLVDITE